MKRRQTRTQEDVSSFAGLATLAALGASITEDLEELYGEAPKLFSGKRHARYIRPDTVYHVASQVFQGRFLLRPCAELNRLIAGVIGKAQEEFPKVQLFAYAFMSNHMHLEMQGPPGQFVHFVGYIKREISRRWGRNPRIDWPGGMWDESFFATALPTEASQERCFRYILSQGVKEDLVSRPGQWPGVHCAKQLVGATPLKGEWLNGTEYRREKDANDRLKPPRQTCKADYYYPKEVVVSPLPIWAQLTENERRAIIAATEQDIVAEHNARRQQEGIKVVGIKRIQTIPRETRTAKLGLPWFESRRRMICWADPRDPVVTAYNQAYRYFQGDFRAASRAWRGGSEQPCFPDGAFLPGRHLPFGQEPLALH